MRESAGRRWTGGVIAALVGVAAIGVSPDDYGANLVGAGAFLFFMTWIVGTQLRRVASAAIAKGLWSSSDVERLGLIETWLPRAGAGLYAGFVATSLVRTLLG